MKILIRLPNWLGDLVMSTAFVNAVSELYPDAQIDIIIKQELFQLAQLIAGINEVIPFSKTTHPGVRGAFKFGKTIRQNKYALYFNLPVSFSSLIMAYASGAVKRIGFKEAGAGIFLSNLYSRPANVHRVDEYVSLAENFAGKKTDKKIVRIILKKAPSQESKIVINFNSEAESRRMPVDKGTTLLRLLLQNFNSQFILIGSKKDGPFINSLLAGVPDSSRFYNLTGQTNLVQLTELLSGASVLLTTDSGPAHLANSVGTPVIALFGAGNEFNTSPYNKKNLTVLRAGKLSCEPCVKNDCRLYDIPRCMQLIDEIHILKALRLYLPDA